MVCSGAAVVTDARFPLPTPAACCPSRTASASASPIAVPPKLGYHCSVSSASRTRRWSVVGGAATAGSPAKAISPICSRSGTLSRNSRTAAVAAPMRDGLTSFASIDRDTSTTRITVARSFGTSVVRCGRATPTHRAATASRNRTGGTYCRQIVPLRTPASTSTFVNLIA